MSHITNESFFADITTVDNLNDNSVENTTVNVNISLIDLAKNLTTYNASRHENVTSAINFTSALGNTSEVFETDDKDIAHYESVVTFMWTIASPIFLFMGVGGNTMSLLVLRKMRFWEKPALFFLTPLVITDMVVLCTGLSRYWVLFVYDYDLRVVSNVGCKFSYFMLYLSMQLSSWLLVCFTLERFIKTNFPFKYISYVTVKKEMYLFLFVVVILIGVNLHFFFTNGIIGGSTEERDCTSLTPTFYYFDNEIFVFIDLIVLSIAPAVLMAIMNIFIHRKLRKSVSFKEKTAKGQASTIKSKKYNASVTRMLLASNSYFLITTLPISAYFIVDTRTAHWTGLLAAKKDVAWASVYILQYSNYAVNFIIYTVINEQFRKNLIAMMTCSDKG